VQFLGVPLVSGSRLGTIDIEAGAVLVSHSRGTALGVRGPVVLRVLASGARIRIGADCGLSGTVICAAKSVTLGKRCLVGADVMIFDTDFHNHPAAGRRHAVPDWDAISAPVTIGDDVFIGARATICKGVTIGNGSIVGAGSVVVSDVPPLTVVAGSPARVVSGVPPE
jgi:acetyltransferase-like isoleucine patch superfamily enzyme